MLLGYMLTFNDKILSLIDMQRYVKNLHVQTYFVFLQSVRIFQKDKQTLLKDKQTLLNKCDLGSIDYFL